MTEPQIKKAKQFRKLHFSDEVLITPNAWDAVSAKIYEVEGSYCEVNQWFEKNRNSDS